MSVRLRAWLVAGLALLAGATALYRSERGTARCDTGADACGFPPGAKALGPDVDEARSSALADGRPRLLAFSSAYCPACARMKPVLADIERACRDDGVIAAVDVDQDDDALASRHRVSALPTFLAIDAQGLEVARFVGVQSRETLQRAVEEVRGEQCAARDADGTRDRQAETTSKGS